MSNGPSGAQPESYLFSGPTIGSPLEELGDIFEKKYATCTHLGEHDRAELLREAHELARAHLAAQLHEKATPDGEPQADESPELNDLPPLAAPESSHSTLDEESSEPC